MRKMIGLREVRALQPGQTVWDAAVTGFLARRQKSGALTYLVFYRTTESRQRWHTIGRHGAPWTGQRKATTVAELCDACLADAEAGRLLTRRRTAKKASTAAALRG